MSDPKQHLLINFVELNENFSTLVLDHVIILIFLSCTPSLSSNLGSHCCVCVSISDVSRRLLRKNGILNFYRDRKHILNVYISEKMIKHLRNLEKLKFMFGWLEILKLNCVFFLWKLNHVLNFERKMHLGPVWIDLF